MRQEHERSRSGLGGAPAARLGSLARIGPSRRPVGESRCLALLASCGGFNLIEVTVAVGILGVAMAGTIRAVPTAYQTIFRAGEVTTATALAQQRIEQLRNRPMADAALTAGTTDETNLPNTPGFVRRTIVADVAGEGTKQITVQIIQTARGQTAPTVALTTLRGQ